MPKVSWVVSYGFYSKFRTLSTHTHTQLFYGPFSGISRQPGEPVPEDQKRTSGLYGARED